MSTVQRRKVTETAKNSHIWKQHGVGTAGHDKCDETFELMRQAVTIAGPELAKIVFREAEFQVFELPNRTPEFRRKYTWKKPQ